ncbi:kielin/chordin-like protein [Pollicipes pollicipes]|uniref:kielin/chordin-like protein n=1 Tax=Pollicipes pollicipes TaxID=41117 RepID=UPI001885469C|nr:kielin/chordin-like protein [Pollicipes pollicipes]
MESGQWGRWLPLLVLLAASVIPASSAPLEWDEDEPGCFHMMQHYNNGDQIVTDEPCLNCTCRNNMLMCFLKVCPYVMPLTKGCSMEKKPGDCCATVTCEQVPVPIMQMLGMMNQTATTEVPPTALSPLAVGDAGCQVDGQYYADGAQVPSDPNEPCDVCYCIRNHTACVQQECTMRVPGCQPIYAEGICCPVRYVCDYETTTLAPITTLRPDAGNTGCVQNGVFYNDGDQIPSEDPCQHCYCMHSEVKCAIQDCASPLDHAHAQCKPVPPSPGQCCPDQYNCGGITHGGGSVPPGGAATDGEEAAQTEESSPLEQATTGHGPASEQGSEGDTVAPAGGSAIEQPSQTGESGLITGVDTVEGDQEPGEGAAGDETELIDSQGVVQVPDEEIETSGDGLQTDGSGSRSGDRRLGSA